VPVPTPQAPPTVSEQPAPTESFATTGTGFTVSDDGFVLTNRHVVENCGSVTIHDRGPATVREVDQTNDLALLKMQGSTVAATFRIYIT
jgi:S1-C subfamily serine protease